MPRAMEAGVAATALASTASNYARIFGANDRISVGIVGFSDRVRSSLIPSFHKVSDELNFEVVALSDMWTSRRDQGGGLPIKTYWQSGEMMNSTIMQAAEMDMKAHLLSGRSQLIMRTYAALSLASVGVVLLLVSSFAARSSDAPADRIRLAVNEADRRVDIIIDGQPFTSYVWPTKLAKPVLYPLRTASGTVVTRGYPLEPRAGERVDHPHHAGLWLNYESVNGLDFWNNSEAIKAESAPKMGTIQHSSIVSAKSGSNQGELEVEAAWMTHEKKILLKEHTRFVFRGGPNFRSVDRITTLRAQDQKVVFADAKDGMLGLRVVRALEMPSDKPEVYTDASGRVTTVAKLDNTGVNGIYLTSEGKKGDAAWGTRGRWCNLSGKVGDEPVTITILDHPANPGFPTYWHARGYGLFAANPLGQNVFSNGKEELNLTLAPGESVTFRYRILIFSEITTPENTEAAYKDFVAAYH